MTGLSMFSVWVQFEKVQPDCFSNYLSPQKEDISHY